MIDPPLGFINSVNYLLRNIDDIINEPLPGLIATQLSFIVGYVSLISQSAFF